MPTIARTYPSSQAREARDERIIVAEIANGQERPWGKSFHGLILSTYAPWRDLLKVEEYRVPPIEYPERISREHFIAMWMGPPGTIKLKVAGAKRCSKDFGPHELSVIGSGVPFWSEMTQETQALYAGLDAGFVADVARRETNTDAVELNNQQQLADPQIESIMLALRAELSEGCPAGRLFGEGLATALASLLLRKYSVRPVRSPEPRGGLAPARLRKVLAYIAEQLGEELSLGALADCAHLSPHHFSIAFKASTGLPPYRYVIEQRMREAKRMLTESGAPLAEIAQSVGFSSQAQFTTMFRKLVGTTPGRYRSQVRS